MELQIAVDEVLPRRAQRTHFLPFFLCDLRAFAVEKMVRFARSATIFRVTLRVAVFLNFHFDLNSCYVAVGGLP